MINDLKLAFRLLKYSYQYKVWLVSGLIFLLVGISMIMVADFGNMAMAGIYFVLPVSFLSQMCCSMQASMMVRTSSWQRAFQTKIPVCLILIGNLFLYTVLWIFIAVLLSVRPGMSVAVWNVLLSYGIFAIVLGCYYTAGLKYFWLSTIIFLVVFIIIAILGGFLSYGEIAWSGKAIFSPFVQIAVGYVMIFIAAALQYGVSCLLYKKDFSKMAFSSQLKRAAQ